VDPRSGPALRPPDPPGLGAYTVFIPSLMSPAEGDMSWYSSA
jgi:hypothetical protein